MGKINVLYVCHDTEVLGGAALSLWNLIHSLKDDIDPIILLRERGNVYDYFFHKGIDCLVVPFRLNKNATDNALKGFYKRLAFNLINARCVRRVSKELKDRHISIVHSNDSVITVGSRIAKALKARHIWHLREISGYITPLTGEKRRKEMILKADSAVAITNYIKKDWGLENAGNAVVIPDAVRSKEDVAMIVEKDRYFVFCAAEINPWKGPELAINAFWLSGLAKSGYSLKMVGQINDSYLVQLKQLARQCEIEDAVEFTGKTSDMKSIMSHASGFLMCSKSEGLGRVTIEAMFYGCPVLARNDSGGTMEIVKDNETGLIFNDAVDLSAKMRFVASEDIVPMIERAQEYALGNFCEESYKEKMLGLYEKVLKG